MKKKGLFISLEGPDGSGKSTQAKMLADYFEKIGKEVILTREPGGTKISEKIRHIILDPENLEMHGITEALLYAAARAQHVSEVILPNIIKEKIIITDRFVDSSIVYQGYGRKLGESVKMINDIAIMGNLPDITILLMIEPQIGKNRIKEYDRLEMEGADYHNEVYDAYLQLMKNEPDRIKGVDASGTPIEIQKRIIEVIDEFCGK